MGASTDDPRLLPGQIRQRRAQITGGQKGITKRYKGRPEQKRKRARLIRNQKLNEFWGDNFELHHRDPHQHWESIVDKAYEVFGSDALPSPYFPDGPNHKQTLERTTLAARFSTWHAALQRELRPHGNTDKKKPGPRAAR